MAAIEMVANFRRLWTELESRFGERRWFVLIDENLERRGANPTNGLKAKRRDGVVWRRGGEQVKSLRQLQSLYDEAMRLALGRDALVIVVGGGTLGDLGGFFAATWMRGIDWVCVATTTLSMADSAVGGKTAIDYRQIKNPIGAFHAPLSVMGVEAALGTLTPRHRRAGLAEVVKSAIIADAPLFRRLEGSVAALNEGSPEIWAEVLGRAAAIKRDVVSEDPFEKGRRAILNFGHTFGHAYESVSRPRLLHGEAVAVGMIAASWLSEQSMGAPKGTMRSVVDLLHHLRLLRALRTVDRAKLWEALSYDKKAKGRKTMLVLTPRIGSATLTARPPRNLLQRALQQTEKEITALLT